MAERKYVPYLEIARNILRETKDKDGNRVYTDEEIEKIINESSYDDIARIIKVDPFIDLFIQDALFDEMKFRDSTVVGVSGAYFSNYYGEEHGKKLFIRKGEARKGLWRKFHQRWLVTAKGRTNEERILKIFSNCQFNLSPHRSFSPDTRYPKDRELPFELAGLENLREYLLVSGPVFNRIGVNVDEEKLIYAYNEKIQKYLKDRNINSREDLEKHLSNIGLSTAKNVKGWTEEVEKNVTQVRKKAKEAKENDLSVREMDHPNIF